MNDDNMCINFLRINLINQNNDEIYLKKKNRKRCCYYCPCTICRTRNTDANKNEHVYSINSKKIYDNFIKKKFK